MKIPVPFFLVKPLLSLFFIPLLISVAAADDSQAVTDSVPQAPAAVTPPSTPSNGDNQVLVPVHDVGFAADSTVKDADGYQVRIGELYSPGGEAYILPFRLPALPPGQQFKGLHFRVQVMSISSDNDTSPLGNGDLFVLGVRDNFAPVDGDYFQGTPPDPKATLIQPGFLNPQSPVRTDSTTGPFVETTPDADAKLVAYVNDLYAKGDVAGKYLLSASATTSPLSQRVITPTSS